MVTLINQLVVTGDVEEFLAVAERLSAFMSRQPGYRSHSLLRSLREPLTYVELAEWDRPEQHGAAVRSDEFQALIQELAKVVAKPSPGLFETVRPAVA